MQQPCYHTEITLCTRMKPHLGGRAPFHWGKVQMAVILGEQRNDAGTEEMEHQRKSVLIMHRMCGLGIIVALSELSTTGAMLDVPRHHCNLRAHHIDSYTCQNENKVVIIIIPSSGVVPKCTNFALLHF